MGKRLIQFYSLAKELCSLEYWLLEKVFLNNCAGHSQFSQLCISTTCDRAFASRLVCKAAEILLVWNDGRLFRRKLTKWIPSTSPGQWPISASSPRGHPSLAWLRLRWQSLFTVQGTSLQSTSPISALPPLTLLEWRLKRSRSAQLPSP